MNYTKINILWQRRNLSNCVSASSFANSGLQRSYVQSENTSSPTTHSLLISYIWENVKKINVQATSIMEVPCCWTCFGNWGNFVWKFVLGNIDKVPTIIATWPRTGSSGWNNLAQHGPCSLACIGPGNVAMSDLLKKCGDQSGTNF